MINKHLYNFIISITNTKSGYLGNDYYMVNDRMYLFQLQETESGDFVLPEFDYVLYNENKFKEYLKILKKRRSDGPNS